MLGASAALALILAASGTFAWQTYQDQKLNRVKSASVASDSVTINETWSKTPITPGGQATKDVKVTNASDVQVFVRASFEEVMRYLTSQGVEKDQTDPTEYNPATADLADDIPVSFAGDSANLTSQGYTDITSKVTGLPTLPAGATGKIEVWGKGSATANPVTPSNIDYTLETTVFYHYKIGTVDYYQKMTSDIAMTNKPAAGDAVNTWTFSAANTKYYVYAGGYEYNTKNWGKSTLVSPYDTTGATTNTNGFALLGEKGTNNGEKFNYTATFNAPIAEDGGLGKTHTLPTTVSTYPTSAYPKATGDKLGGFAEADAFSVAPEITIEYGDLSDAFSTISNDTWVYNQEDGWFYYMAKVDQSYSASGTAGTTNSLIKSLNYGNISTQHKDINYDLVAKVEAVQANDMAAVTDTFGLSGSAASGSATKAIYDYLAGL